MSGRRDKKLTREDRILWGKVARSVTPMPGKVADEDEAEPQDFAVMLDAPPVAARPQRQASPPVAMPPYSPERQATARGAHGIDRTTRAKLAKGRLAIEGKVDLHDLTQSEAHALLLSFLHRAYADGRRHVLVVTGKGASLGSEGILRRAVPGWLATPPFRALVSAYEPAASRHGGSGALYIRLRRKDAATGGRAGMTPFGERMREMREERGVTQKQMAAALGVSPAYLSALEHGRRGVPSWPLIQKIVGYFNVIWDEAEDLQRLAAASRPRVGVDTAGLSPQATLLANRLAAVIATLSEADIAELLSRLDEMEKRGR